MPIPVSSPSRSKDHVTPAHLIIALCPHKACVVRVSWFFCEAAVAKPDSSCQLVALLLASDIAFFKADTAEIEISMAAQIAVGKGISVDPTTFITHGRIPASTVQRRAPLSGNRVPRCHRSTEAGADQAASKCYTSA